MTANRIADFDGSSDEKDRAAPTMSRSRGQLAASYAPGAFFTFEGGLGACIAQPDWQAGMNPLQIHPTVKNQIVLRFDDAVKSWFDTTTVRLKIEQDQLVVRVDSIGSGGIGLQGAWKLGFLE